MKMFLILLLLSFNSFALTTTYSFKDYEESSKSANYIKLESESTKLGILTTSFDGFVKKFQISAKNDQAFLRNIEVKFEAKSIDTDNSSRDEKMYEQTLSADKFKYIVIKINSAVRIFDSKETSQRIPALLHIRGKNFPITLQANVYKVGNIIKVSGNTQVSLQKLEIPDPSIAIAKVRDLFDLKFQVELK